MASWYTSVLVRERGGDLIRQSYTTNHTHRLCGVYFLAWQVDKQRQTVLESCIICVYCFDLCNNIKL